MIDSIFQKGDRVRLSRYGIDRLITNVSTIPADRVGTISTRPQLGSDCYSVLWDGSKYPQRLFGGFLVLDHGLDASRAEAVLAKVLELAS